MLHRSRRRTAAPRPGESLIAFTEVTAKFLKPAYPGDTLYPLLTVTGLKPQRTTGLATMRATIHNQREELVLDGSHTYLLKKRRPAS